MNRLGRPQLPAPWAICGSNSKQIDRGVPEIRDLGYFKRINGLRFWCLQNPLKIATFWDPPNFAKSCPANFAAVKKFRVRNNEHVAPSEFSDSDDFLTWPWWEFKAISVRNCTEFTSAATQKVHCKTHGSIFVMQYQQSLSHNSPQRLIHGHSADTVIMSFVLSTWSEYESLSNEDQKFENVSGRIKLRLSRRRSFINKDSTRSPESIKQNLK